MIENVNAMKPGDRVAPGQPIRRPQVVDLADFTLFICSRNSKPSSYIECQSHAKGRLFVVVINGREKGKFLNRPDTAYRRFKELAS